MNDRGLAPKVEGRASAVFTAGGVTAAAALMAAGLARVPFVDRVPETAPRHAGELWDAFFRADPLAWTTTGCIVLMATPVARMLWIGAAFLRRRRPKFAAAALAVLVVVLSGVAVS